MEGVERSNRFVRERLAGSLDNLRTDPQDVPVRGGGPEVRAAIGAIGFRQLAE